MSRLQTSLNLRWGRPVFLFPAASSPYRRSLGILPSSIRRTCPSQRSLRCRRRVNMEGRLARERTSVLGTFSSHEMPSMRRRQRIWKELSLLSCLAYVVHVSLPYNKVLTTQALYTAILVLMVSLGFSHTLEVRRARVVAALPILLSISASSEILLLMVEPSSFFTSLFPYKSLTKLRFHIA